MLKPTMISVGIQEIMRVWNDYLLPYLVLDINEYRTIPIHIQYLKGSYGTVDLGATMALILLSIIPVIVFYLICQKYIIKGVAFVQQQAKELYSGINRFFEHIVSDVLIFAADQMSLTPINRRKTRLIS